ncbi:hypothetical protein [Xanthomarina gelatinilytica]|uniref:hypothetical protein n=1 Tax=Xanthomarina gelatinilytica TaxID=1137281 RepID=UPI003AA9D70D
MLLVIQEVIDPQTKIVFSRMNDRSILLKVPGEIKLFSKNDLSECDREPNLSSFSKKEVIEAFKRVDLFFNKKSTRIITALDGM